MERRERNIKKQIMVCVDFLVPAKKKSPEYDGVSVGGIQRGVPIDNVPGLIEYGPCVAQNVGKLKWRRLLLAPWHCYNGPYQVPSN